MSIANGKKIKDIHKCVNLRCKGTSTVPLLGSKGMRSIFYSLQIHALKTLTQERFLNGLSNPLPMVKK